MSKGISIEVNINASTGLWYGYCRIDKDIMYSTHNHKNKYNAMKELILKAKEYSKRTNTPLILDGYRVR